MKKSGFTLVEIMVVVALIGVLAAIAIPSFTKIRAGYRKSSCQNGQRLVAHALAEWAIEKNVAEDAVITAEDGSNIVTFLKDGHLPKCPEGDVEIAIPPTMDTKVACPVAAVTAAHTIP